MTCEKQISPTASPVAFTGKELWAFKFASVEKTKAGSPKGAHPVPADLQRQLEV